ncbi:MAG: uroporphyrinogen decarboxylase [Candidatus Poribacteria bacterium]|nr:MAG: uroporphyrinogen decarboxylase [Candidatus Poribacteria bacterium]
MRKKTEWTPRERIRAALNHEEADRVPIHDTVWGTTLARWRREGMPPDVSPFDYFHYEMVAYGADTSPQFPPQLIEETETYRIERNANGAVVRNWKHQTSTPEMIDFTIKTREDWERHKERFRMNPSRVSAAALADARRRHEQGYWVCYSGVLGYDKTQAIVGSENLLIAMVEDPEWVAEMFMTMADLIIETAQAMIQLGYPFDGAFLYDDMGYRNASLFSPKMYRELEKPGHAKVFEFFHDHGMPVILHSCGCVKELIPDLLDAGLDCLQPLEVKAGMDLIELKSKYGDRLAFMGGIDVRKMADPDPSVIEEEIRTKVGFAKQGGGYIYHSDHSVPDNVSFQQYCRVIELVREYGRYDG